MKGLLAALIITAQWLLVYCQGSTTMDKPAGTSNSTSTAFPYFVEFHNVNGKVRTMWCKHESNDPALSHERIKTNPYCTMEGGKLAHCSGGLETQGGAIISYFPSLEECLVFKAKIVAAQ